MHLVGYHNTEKMGFSLLESPNRLAFLTSKRVDHLVGAIVWAIAGEGKPRTYALGARFVVDEAGAVEGYDINVIRGTSGDVFEPMIPLNDLPWFAAFRRSQSNFSLGLQPIAYEFVVELESLVSELLHRDGFPTVDAYIQAFSEIRERLSESQLRMLRAHYESPNHQLTTRQLAAAAGFSSHTPVNSQYGRLGTILRDATGWHGIGQKSYVFAWFNTPPGGECIWTLHPPVVAALSQLDWIAVSTPQIRPGFRLAEELAAKPLIEGASDTVLVNAYERNAAARMACIGHFGATCAVCTFDFEYVYGQVGAGFIHVHHLVPLSEIGESYVVDPIKHLRPVCPNCHAMIHRKEPPYSLDELRALIGVTS